MNARYAVIALAVPAWLAAAPLAAQPLDTAFTYQGRLQDGGIPAAGLHDLRFSLFDALAGGTQIGATLCFDNVNVTDGLVTQALDFGAQFIGQQRFLEIEVRGDTGLDCADPSGFVVLTPRQPLTATPNALLALNADKLDELDSTAFLQSIPVPLTLSDTSATHIIRGENASGASSASGVSGVSTALGGFTYGVHGRSDSSSGIGVFGSAAAFTGTAIGGRFESASGSGVGVFGFSTSTLGVTSGVSGRSLSTSGRGVLGVAAATSGTTYGVYGQSDSPAATAYGVWAQGRLGASGTKTSRIDHPDDPANKYLLHYAAESPEVINFYTGTVTLDNRGEVTVELPHYFARINRKPRYQLTAVGAPMPLLHVAEKISESALTVGAKVGPDEVAPLCSFRIAGGVPGGEVSWEVKAVRNDRWVQQRGAPVEIEKEDFERGTYQHPELYGQPPEKGIFYHPQSASTAAPQGPTRK